LANYKWHYNVIYIRNFHFK